MAENENENKVQNTEEVVTEEETPEAPAATETPTAPAEEPVSEIKGIIESLRKEIKSLREEINSKDIQAPESKANSKAVISNNNTQSLGKEVKSVAGLNELS